MMSSSPITFRLLGWSAAAGSLVTPDDWRGWAGEAPAGLPTEAAGLPPGDLPMMLRRRATPVGRAVLAAAAGLPHVREARYLLSSRHGELARTASILTSLARREPPSPADFSMSVHHGLSGLLSIAFRNRKGHSAVSAGRESFCYGMLEAAACLAERPDEPVILLHYDERPEGFYAELVPAADREGPIAAALCLGGRGSAGGLPLTLGTAPHRSAAATESPVLDFLAFLLTGAAEAVHLGERTAWEWRRA